LIPAAPVIADSTRCVSGFRRAILERLSVKAAMFRDAIMKPMKQRVCHALFPAEWE